MVDCGAPRARALQPGRCSLGAAAWALQPGRCSLGAAAWALQPGRCSLGAAAWALQPGRCSLGAAAWALARAQQKGRAPCGARPGIQATKRARLAARPSRSRCGLLWRFREPLAPLRSALAVKLRGVLFLQMAHGRDERGERVKRIHVILWIDDLVSLDQALF